MTNKVDGIAKKNLHPHDDRKIWNKYDEVHINKTSLYIEDAIAKHTVQGILEIRDEVVARLLTDNIVLSVDSNIVLFDRIWERVSGEFQFSPEPVFVDPAPLEEKKENEDDDDDPILQAL